MVPKLTRANERTYVLRSRGRGEARSIVIPLLWNLLPFQMDLNPVSSTDCMHTYTYRFTHMWMHESAWFHFLQILWLLLEFVRVRLARVCCVWDLFASVIIDGESRFELSCYRLGISIFISVHFDVVFYGSVPWVAIILMLTVYCTTVLPS